MEFELITLISNTVEDTCVSWYARSCKVKVNPMRLEYYNYYLKASNYT